MKRLSKTTRSNFVTYAIVVVAFVIMQILSVTGHVSNSLAGQLVPICVYICMAVSLNLTVGILGELSLGHAGFMSVGAFTGVVVAMSIQNAAGPVRPLLAIIIGGIMAGVAGVIVGVPVLRLRGDYLAIVTLAFGEIIKNLLNNIYAVVDAHGLHFSMKDTASLNLDNGTILINGPMGAPGIEKLSTFVAGFILVMFVLIVTLNLIRSRSGRAIMAIRDNRIAAESVGINITKYKLMAFVTSAVLAGMAGALYAMNYSSILPNLYSFLLVQSQHFSTEALNPHSATLRMRGRPKVVLARSYEEAWDLYTKYSNNTLGVISDARFPLKTSDTPSRSGQGLSGIEKDPEAGMKLLRAIRANDEYVPLIMESAESENRASAEAQR